ncbi:hypothetical protein L7F22_051969 [Adiantum nelumboides]|nr:hypothetical protein [Adiantum nelumboides]
MRTPTRKCAPRATPKAFEEKQSRRKGSSSKTPSSSCKEPHTSKHNDRNSSDTTAPKERHNIDQSEMIESMGKSSIAQVGRSTTKKKGENRMDEYPILNKFCYTVQELHEEYGLSIQGKVAKDLSGYDLPDDQWLTIFQHRSKPGGLDKKVENWKRANGASHGGLQGSNKKRHYTQGASNMCIIEEDKFLQFETVAVDYISDLDAIVHGVLTSSTQKLNRLIELRASLQQNKDSLLRLKGSNVVTKKIKEDILLFEQRLDKLHWHKYHPLCFATTLMKNDICAKVGCNKRISEVAKTWAHKGHVKKKYEVKEKYTDNHATDKHSKAEHIFDEEMEDCGKCCDVEMDEAATRSFQGMSNEVQSNKLDEDKDTTIGAHKGVNDLREEPDNEGLPDKQDVDKEHPDKDQHDIDKDQKVEVDDENLLPENKDGDKVPL